MPLTSVTLQKRNLVQFAVDQFCFEPHHVSFIMLHTLPPHPQATELKGHILANKIYFICSEGEKAVSLISHPNKTDYPEGCMLLHISKHLYLGIEMKNIKPVKV